MTAHPPTLIVVTGSRTLGARDLISDAMHHHVTRGSRLFHGANGVAPRLAVRYDPYPPVSADALADSIWRTWTRHSVRPAELFPADWTGPCRASCRPHHRRPWRDLSVCPAAGPYRNQVMIDAAVAARRQGWQVRVLAFPSGASPGTRDCMRRALAAGLEVIPVHPASAPRSVRYTRRITPPAVPHGE
jgi:hypothetical protein